MSYYYFVYLFLNGWNGKQCPFTAVCSQQSRCWLLYTPYILKMLTARATYYSSFFMLPTDVLDSYRGYICLLYKSAWSAIVHASYRCLFRIFLSTWIIFSYCLQHATGRLCITMIALQHTLVGTTISSGTVLESCRYSNLARWIELPNDWALKRRSVSFIFHALLMVFKLLPSMVVFKNVFMWASPSRILKLLVTILK
jgi:hypothetical protein